MLWDVANTGLEAAEKASVAALSGIDTFAIQNRRRRPFLTASYPTSTVA